VVGKRRKDDAADPSPASAPDRLNDGAFAGLADLAPSSPTTTDDEADDAGTATTAPSAEHPADPRLSAKIVVRREKKGRGGKTVTRVQGLSGSTIDDLLPTMKKALGCGAVREGDDLVLLGSLVPRAAAFLRDRGATVVEGN